MPRGLHAPNNVRFKRCVRCDAPDDAIGTKFEKASPFRPRIAPTRPLLGQCDAIATGRYISLATYRDGGLYASSLSGIVRPSCLAVLALMANSKAVGRCTGRSAGLSPLRMRST